MAKRLAYSMMNEKDDTKIQFIQFHQNYSYEDFIMGYKPDGNGFKLEEGIFYTFCNKAKEDREHQYFFIIDEINRGNLSKIFGELLMAIENNYRDEEIILAYNKQKFTVPSNVYIIGMMNTADRSLAMIDYALRRRFSFIEMEPAFDNDTFIKYSQQFGNTYHNVIREIKLLNEKIKEDSSLGRGFTIGHSYFMPKNNEVSKEWLGRVIKYDILPTLEEYWFDDLEQVNEWKNRFLKVLDYGE